MLFPQQRDVPSAHLAFTGSLRLNVRRGESFSSSSRNQEVRVAVASMTMEYFSSIIPLPQPLYSALKL